MINVQEHTPETFPRLTLHSGRKRMLYLGGQVAQNEDGHIVGKGDLYAQLIQIFDHIGRFLARSGADFKHIVKVAAYVVACQPGDQSIYMDIIQHYIPLGKHLSIATLVSVDSLAKPDQLVEVEIVASVPFSDQLGYID